MLYWIKFNLYSIFTASVRITSLIHAYNATPVTICNQTTPNLWRRVGTAYAIMTSLSIINASICAVCCVVVHYAYTSATPSLHYAITGGLMLWAVLFNSISSIISKVPLFLFIFSENQLLIQLGNIISKFLCNQTNYI